MSENGGWTDVPKSGKGKKGKGAEKGSEKRPQTANGPASNVAKGGSGSATKEPKAKEVTTTTEASPAKKEDCPWLDVSDESDDGAKPGTATPDSSKGGKKKRNKKKKKNKDTPEPERDAKTAKVEDEETAPSQLTNGAAPDTVKTTGPKPTDAKPKSEEATQELTETTSTEPSETTKPDDGAASLDTTPMSWEDEVENANNASNETELPSAGDGDGSCASQDPTNTADKGKASTENSAGEGSPAKKRAESGERPKVSFELKKRPQNLRQRSPERPKTESSKKDGSESSRQQRQKSPKRGKQEPARDRSQHSTERKQTGASGGNEWQPANKDKPKQRNQARDKQGPPKGAGQQPHEGGKPAKKKKEKREPFSVPGCEGFELIEINNDLFQCDFDDAMAHCVSEDLEMGKGIAVEFKKRFHGVGELRDQKKKVGEVAVLYRDGNYVYYLITKPQYFQKPTYQSLRASLEAMRDHCVQHKVPSLAMPQIGCGLDRLDWDNVTEIIKDIFKNTGMKIKIFYL